VGELLSETPGLEIVEGAVEDLLLDRDGSVCGVVLGDERRYETGRVVLTTGTFLNGLIHIGEEKIPAGRVGEKPSVCLPQAPGECGLRDRRAAVAAALYVVCFHNLMVRGSNMM
jgi:tRNA uridine 5-carboxymethylaminomethyl modification enzyme